jgi:hypothetical protein
VKQVFVVVLPDDADGAILHIRVSGGSVTCVLETPTDRPPLLRPAITRERLAAQAAYQSTINDQRP